MDLPPKEGPVWSQYVNIDVSPPLAIWALVVQFFLVFTHEVLGNVALFWDSQGFPHMFSNSLMDGIDSFYNVGFMSAFCLAKSVCNVLLSPVWCYVI